MSDRKSMSVAAFFVCLTVSACGNSQSGNIYNGHAGSCSIGPKAEFCIELTYSGTAPSDPKQEVLTQGKKDCRDFKGTFTPAKSCDFSSGVGYCKIVNTTQGLTRTYSGVVTDPSALPVGVNLCASEGGTFSTTAP